MSDRASWLIDVADLSKELLVEVRTSTPHSRDRIKGVTRHRVRHAPLISQLYAALPPGRAGEDTRGGKPGSRSPVNDAALNALLDIEGGWPAGGTWRVGAADLRSRLRRQCGKERGRPVPLVSSLREIRSLATVAPDTGTEEARDALAAYVALAKATLAYEAPVATLRDVCCPECSSRLRVAADASSDVWCPDATCRTENGDRRTWPRQTWPFLLARLGGEAAG